MFRKNWATSSRTGRTVNTLDPLMTKQILLQNYENNEELNRIQDGTLSRTRMYC